MEVLEKQRQEEERREQDTSGHASTSDISAVKENELPPSLLAPLLKRHEDLDTELRRRLEQLESK